MNLINVKNEVKDLLETKPKTRDSDTYLVSLVWTRYLNADLKKMDAIDLLVLFSNNKLPSYESITRVRRKLQETNPELRGKNYYTRQHEQENVKSQLKEIS